MPSVDDLGRALGAVGDLIAGIRPEQWSAPTPCDEWNVHRVVDHLAGMNKVFVALLAGERPPRRAGDQPSEDPVATYKESAAALYAAFDQPGVLERTYSGPLGDATGAERLQIRMYDLLAHGWDLARATGQPVDLPADLAAQSLAFVRTQVSDESRPGRFLPPQPVTDEAPAIERLVAYLGRFPRRS
jgi:uncharacterized protein (TIGR03086 family)